MINVRITGVGSCLPRLRHTDDTLPPLDVPLDKVRRTQIGVLGRHWAGNGESVPEMAATAAGRALSTAGLPAAELDLIILANWTQRRYLPDLAPAVKELLGAESALAFDIGCACAGFLVSLGLAQAFLQRSDAARALVVASETTSRRARPGSNATMVYSDGAGAFVLESGTAAGGELLDCTAVTDSVHRDIMDVSEHGHVRTHIKQRELVVLAAESLATSTDQLLERNGLRAEQVDWFVPHSGTAAIQAALRERTPFPQDRILTNYAQVGNLSSASIPVAVDHFIADGTIRRGDLVLSAAVGTGWYRAAALYRI